MKITIEDIKKKLQENRTDGIEILNYTSTGEKSSFICKDGHIWEARTYGVIANKTGCPTCKSVKMGEIFRKSLDEIIFYMFKEGYTFIEGVYKDSDSILKILCPNGHKFETNWSYFQTGRRCPVCKGIENGNRCRLSEEDYKKRMDNLHLINYTILEDFKGYYTKSSSVCKFGHTTIRNLYQWEHQPHCSECRKIEMFTGQKGELSPLWKGGKNSILFFLRKKNIQWKKDSMENCSYKCVMSGEQFRDIHHLYGFNKIIFEVFEELNIRFRPLVCDYSQEELDLLINKTVEIHRRYPLGVCLSRESHRRFHKVYGRYNNTPEQWEEFKKSL